MSDPGRLLDESEDELERMLLGVARSEKSSPRARARTLAALGITGSAALSAAAVTAAVTPAAVAAQTTARVAGGLAGKVGGHIAWAKLMLGVSALGAIAIAPVVYRAWGPHPASVSAPARAAAPTPATAPVAASMSAAPAPAAVVQATAPTTATGGSAVPATSIATLTRELGALDTIRTAVAAGRAPRALVMLDAYARDFPDGGLALEAEILRIDALAGSGRTAVARRRAAVFVQQHPRSVLAERARQYLEN